jgi:hypothetical protein
LEIAIQFDSEGFEYFIINHQIKLGRDADFHRDSPNWKRIKLKDHRKGLIKTKISAKLSTPKQKQNGNKFSGVFAPEVFFFI